MAEKKKKTKLGVAFGILFGILTLYSLLFLIMLLWGLMVSFKTRSGFFISPFGWPKPFTFENYVRAFETFKVPVEAGSGNRDVKLAEMLLYSLLYVGGATVIATLTPCITAYLVSKYKFRFNKIIYSTVIITMLIPIVGSMPSMLNLTTALKIHDTFWGIWMMKGGFTGMYFLIFYASYKSLSWEYAEAAFIDGAGHTKVLITLMIPLMSKTIFIIALMNGIGFWNDYMTSLVYLPSYPTVAYGLFLYSRSNLNTSTPSQVAGCMLLAIPTFIVFMLFKNKLMGNLTMGGLKG